MPIEHLPNGYQWWHFCSFECDKCWLSVEQKSLCPERGKEHRMLPFHIVDHGDGTIDITWSMGAKKEEGS